MNEMDQPVALTPSDRKLLELVQSQPTMSKQEMAQAAGMSVSTLWRRINELEAAGVIAGRAVLLDPIKVGLPVCAVLSVNLVDYRRETLAQFEDFVSQRPEITQCLRVTGGYDYLLITRSNSVQGFEHFLMSQVLAHPAVASTSSQIAMSQKKYTTKLPL